MDLSRPLSRARHSVNRLLVVLSLVVALVLDPSGRTSAVAQSLRPTSVRSCAYTAHDLGRMRAFEQLVGMPVDCALVFNRAAPTWAEWVDPWFAHAPATQPQYQWHTWVRDGGGRRSLVIGQSLIPDAAPADWRERGALGEYDAHARALAANLVRRGLGNSVILLAHEANGNWNRDSVGSTPQQWRAWSRYWARVARVMRSVPGSRFKFDWTVNAGYRAIPFSAYYPGDDAVDIIGIDQYDAPALAQAPRSGPQRWARLAAQPGGINSLAAFARIHGKPLSVPESGLVSSAAGGAGDDPAFVEGLAQVTRRQATAYVSYFDKNVNGVLRLRQTPRSLAAWRRHFALG